MGRWLPLLWTAALSAAGAADDTPRRVAPDGLWLLAKVDPELPPSLMGKAPQPATPYPCAIDVVVERSGAPSSATAQRDDACPPAAAAAAQEALMQWRWSPPTLVTGEVVRAQARIRIRFQEPLRTAARSHPVDEARDEVLRLDHVVQPDGFPTCNLRIGLDRDGHPLERHTNHADCLVRAPDGAAAPAGIVPGQACMLTFEVADGAANAIEYVRCDGPMKAWLTALTDGWTWTAPDGLARGFMVRVEVLR